MLGEVLTAQSQGEVTKENVHWKAVVSNHESASGR
jgi:hypothetical protein